MSILIKYTGTPLEPVRPPRSCIWSNPCILSCEEIPVIGINVSELNTHTFVKVAVPT